FSPGPSSFMAARQLQRRLSSLLFTKKPQTYPVAESSRQFLHPLSTIFGPANYFKRGVTTCEEPNTNEVAEEHAAQKDLQLEGNHANFTSVTSNDSSSVKFTAMSNLKTSSRHDMAMIFTCKVCETRSVKTACRESYEKGVVVVRCGGCNNLHLIADRLGWFGETGSVEDFLAARGEEIRKGSLDTLNLTLEDLAGTKS
ncbi:Zinc finger, DNL-type, partial [Dillenia turbinata]